MPGPIQGLPQRDAFFGAPLYLAAGAQVEVELRRLARELGEDPLTSWEVAGDRVRARAARERATEPGAWFFLFDEPREAPEPDEYGIVTIPISGSLMRGMFYDDYARLRERIEGAVADGRVRAILLDIDSPGGRVQGCFELTRYVHAMSKTSGKPIWAVANDYATSAAYAIGRAAARFYATPTGLVGSIGARCVHMDQSGYDRELGVVYTEVASGERKNDMSPHQPLSKEGLATLQAIVTNAGEQFFAEMATYGTLSVDDLRALNAEVFVAATALDEGLIDDVAYRDDVLEELRGELASASSAGRSTVPQAPNPRAAMPAGGPELNETETTETTGAETKKPMTAEARMKQRARLITNACQIAGRPELAGEYIAEGLTVGKVQARLLDMRAEGDGPTVRGQIVDPSTGGTRAAQPVIDTSKVYRRWNNPEKLMKHASEVQ